MGSTGNPSTLGLLLGLVCFLPWLFLIIIAVRDKPRQTRQAAPYREIRPRDNMADERAGFVEAKMQKIERAMK